MRALCRQKVKVYSFNNEDNYYDASGKLVCSEEFKSRYVCCSLQPLVGNSLKIIRDKSGWIAKDCRILYTKDTLITLDETNDDDADTVIYRGEEYEVQSCDPWESITGKLSHNKYLLKKRDEDKRLILT